MTKNKKKEIEVVNQETFIKYIQEIIENYAEPEPEPELKTVKYVNVVCKCDEIDTEYFYHQKIQETKKTKALFNEAGFTLEYKNIDRYLKYEGNLEGFSYKNLEGANILHVCAYFHIIPIVKAILEAAPELALVKNNEGKTPLDLCKEEHAELSKCIPSYIPKAPTYYTSPQSALRIYNELQEINKVKMTLNTLKETQELLETAMDKNRAESASQATEEKEVKEV